MYAEKSRIGALPQNLECHDCIKSASAGLGNSGMVLIDHVPAPHASGMMTHFGILFTMRRTLKTLSSLTTRV